MKTLEANASRQINIDLAKCSAIVFMVLVHTLIEFNVDFDRLHNYIIGYYLGSFMSAPVFMVALGVGLAYSRHQAPFQNMKRGLTILILGYLLNLLRTIPGWIGCLLSHTSDKIWNDLGIDLFEGDILQFAGLAFILFGLLKYFKASDKIILFLGIMLSILGTVLNFPQEEGTPRALLKGLFVLFDDKTDVRMCFPLCNWFIFVVVGYFYGTMLKRITNLPKFYLLTGIFSFLILVPALFYEETNGAGMLNPEDYHYYGISFFDALVSCCYVFLCFAVSHLLCGWFGEKTKRRIVQASDALNLTYMIHWPLLILFAQIPVVFSIEMPYSLILLITLFILLFSVVTGIRLKAYIRNVLKTKPSSLLRFLS